MLWPKLYLQMYAETKHLPFEDAAILLSRFGYQPEDIAIALNHSVLDVKRASKRVQPTSPASKSKIRSKRG